MARDMGRWIHAIKEASYLSAKGISNRKERRDVENKKKNDLGDIAWVAKDDSRDKESTIGIRRFESALKIDSLPFSATFSP